MDVSSVTPGSFRGPPFREFDGTETAERGMPERGSAELVEGPGMTEWPN